MKLGVDMRLNLSAQGDKLERDSFQFINANIPAYMKIWEAYIGNDGSGCILRARNLTADQDKQRVAFSEHHYTVLKDLLQLNNLKEKYKDLKYNDSDYLSYDLDIVAVLALTGNVIDNVERLLELLKVGKRRSAVILASLRGFLEERHAVLHGRKLALRENSGRIQISRTKNTLVPFQSDKEWAQLSSKDFLDFYDYLDKSLGDLCRLVNRALENVLSYLKDWIEATNFQFELGSTTIVSEHGRSGFSRDLVQL
jgi:hypothetical protein